MSGAEARRDFGGDSVRLDVAITHMWQGVRWLIEHQVDMSAQPSPAWPGPRRGTARIEMSCRSHVGSTAPLTCEGLPIPAVPCVALPGFAFSHAINSFKSLRRYGLLRDDELRVARQQGYRFEILHDVVLETVDRSIQHMRPEEADAKRVAVRRCASHAAGANRSGRAGDVFDNRSAEPGMRSSAPTRCVRSCPLGRLREKARSW